MPSTVADTSCPIFTSGNLLLVDLGVQPHLRVVLDRASASCPAAPPSPARPSSRPCGPSPGCGTARPSAAGRPWRWRRCPARPRPTAAAFAWPTPPGSAPPAAAPGRRPAASDCSAFTAEISSCSATCRSWLYSSNSGSPFVTCIPSWSAYELVDPAADLQAHVVHPRLGALEQAHRPHRLVQRPARHRRPCARPCSARPPGRSSPPARPRRRRPAPGPSPSRSCRACRRSKTARASGPTSTGSSSRPASPSAGVRVHRRQLHVADGAVAGVVLDHLRVHAAVPQGLALVCPLSGVAARPAGMASVRGLDFAVCGAGLGARHAPDDRQRRQSAGGEDRGTFQDNFEH